MDIRTATAEELQANFTQYLGFVANGGEVIVTENGKEVGRFVPRSRGFAGGEHLTPLTDSLFGILKSKEDPDKAREEALLKKYANPD